MRIAAFPLDEEVSGTVKPIRESFAINLPPTFGLQRRECHVGGTGHGQNPLMTRQVVRFIQDHFDLRLHQGPDSAAARTQGRKSRQVRPQYVFHTRARQDQRCRPVARSDDADRARVVDNPEVASPDAPLAAPVLETRTLTVDHEVDADVVATILLAATCSPDGGNAVGGMLYDFRSRP
ncbi:hypothetical protein [Microvirga antarctica]|uniref:hypothetical protein n=1 Tax=Microvirga antarctica TaxID=2819233 RepID=UPI001FE60BD1|nr:hypothetical protein [Microvirga antarctica]